MSIGVRNAEAKKARPQKNHLPLHLGWRGFAFADETGRNALTFSFLLILFTVVDHHHHHPTAESTTACLLLLSSIVPTSTRSFVLLLAASWTQRP